MDDDGQYYFTVMMEQQFLEIFGEKNGTNDNGKTKDTIPCEADILESGQHKSG